MNYSCVAGESLFFVVFLNLLLLSKSNKWVSDKKRGKTCFDIASVTAVTSCYLQDFAILVVSKMNVEFFSIGIIDSLKTLKYQCAHLLNGSNRSMLCSIKTFKNGLKKNQTNVLKIKSKAYLTFLSKASVMHLQWKSMSKCEAWVFAEAFTVKR